MLIGLKVSIYMTTTQQQSTLSVRAIVNQTSLLQQFSQLFKECKQVKVKETEELQKRKMRQLLSSIRFLMTLQDKKLINFYQESKDSYYSYCIFVGRWIDLVWSINPSIHPFNQRNCHFVFDSLPRSKQSQEIVGKHNDHGT